VDTFLKLQRLTDLAKSDDKLRKKLIDTTNNPEPLLSFCNVAGDVGIKLCIGELFALGQEYSDNQCKSTNGGNPSPYESFDDTYENFIASIKKT